MQVLDQDGLVFAGARIYSKQTMINKHMPVVSSEDNVTSVSTVVSGENVDYKDVSSTYKGPVPSYAEKVLLTPTDDNTTLFKISLRQTRLV